MYVVFTVCKRENDTTEPVRKHYIKKNELGKNLETGMMREHSRQLKLYVSDKGVGHCKMYSEDMMLNNLN